MKPKLIPESKKIIPKWEKKIRTGNYDSEIIKAPIVLSLADYRFCVVGEAHGFTDDYRKGCEVCYKLGNSIGFSFESAKFKRKSDFGFYALDPKTIKPFMVQRLIQRTNKFLEHFMKVHKSK